MDNRKLSHDGLKSVLKHMEANKRFKISAQCPSIRKIEKKVPLKIDNLTFHSNYMVRINGYCYNLGVIREYREGETPTPIKVMNEQGGCPYDLDQWGFRRQSYGLAITPGDIQIRNSFGVFPPEDYNEEDKERIKTEIQYFKEIFQNPTSRRWVLETPEQMKKRIERSEAELRPYFYRENNMTPPYDCFIQLSTIDTEEDKWTYRSLGRTVYNKHLHEEMKNLLKFMFEGRTNPVHVNTIEVCCKQIIRLPEGVNFKVHELRTPRIEEDFPQLLPILDETCLPLKHIHILGISPSLHSMIDSAEEVTFHNDVQEGAMYSLETILEAPFSKANFISLWTSTDERLEVFIKKVIESDKDVGTRYQLKFNEEIKMEIFLGTFENQLKKELGKNSSVINTNGFLKIRMNSDKVLDVSYRRDNKFMTYNETSSWIFKMEIMKSQK